VKRNKMLNLGLIAGLLVTLAIAGGCAPGQAPEEGGGFDWIFIVFLIVMFGLMYLVLIRPQRKRQKEHQQLVLELKRGDKVITAGGIYGEIETVSDDSIVMKIESGTTIRVAKNSVALRRESETKKEGFY